MLAFMKNLVGVKFDKAAAAGIEALVRWDPKSASETELRTMEQRLDELGREVGLARQSYDKEKREADAIQALSQQRMAAAQQRERADRQAEAARRAAGLASHTSSLTVALKAMQDAAAKDLAAADAQMSKARLLRPTRPEQDDPNIVAAMAAASGKPPALQTLSERLAALKAH